MLNMLKLSEYKWAYITIIHIRTLFYICIVVAIETNEITYFVRAKLFPKNM